jgi:hypothetical protein
VTSALHRSTGPIRGLHLPHNAWVALGRENIMTIDQLRAVADNHTSFDGIGPKTAQAVRAELAPSWALLH